ncbi:protein AKNAD1 [Thamnophis elegans]|uniref:protein AKNAD1 n=1 Tax=Thamnophis elegans TaxID=35005 RepID=UPI0013774A2D|nr:protein AKNAD1 [Thamnophis elegans]
MMELAEIVNSILFDMLYSEDNTDNEQEDLPYDGDLQHRDQCSCDSQNLEEFISVKYVSPTVSTLTSSISNLSNENSDCQKQLSQRKVNAVLLTNKNDVEFAMTSGKEIQFGGFTSSGRNEEFSNSKMSDVLLRHFPTEDFTYQLIDSETIPEISLTDSFDETVLIKNKSSENTGIFRPKEEMKNSERKVSCNLVVKNWDLTQDKLSLIDEGVIVRNSKYCNMDDSQFLIQKEPGRLNEDLNYTSTHKEYQNQQYFLDNTENFHNPQCNEHQVYYRLHDSSETSPKVKELKRSNESFVFKRTKSSTNLLGKDVLEAFTFLESDTIRNQEDENGTFELDQQLEVLTRQAEVQNHIDHLRFNSPKIPPCSNPHTAELSIEAQSAGIASKMSAFSPATIPMEHMFGFSQAPHPESRSKNITSSLPLVDAIRQPSANTPFLQNITDETEQILKKQTEELKANVEIFSECIKQNVFSVQEHFQFLQLLKEQLEQLEHNYVATREKHYALQLQNHKHSSRTIGKFDANRKVEGEIFKLGMFLDDIKEKIEKTFASYSSTYITSPSLTSPPSSICSSYSASPLITSTNEPPKRNVAGLNIPQNENCWKKKNHPVEGTPQKAYKKSIQGHSNHPSQQIPLELQKKNIHLKTMSSGDKARQQTNRHILIKEFDQYPRSHKTKQNYNNEQENTDRNLNDLQIRSSVLENLSSKESNEVDFSLLNEQEPVIFSIGRSALDTFEKVRHSTDKSKIIIHPTLKMQLSRNKICSFYSNRNKTTEYRKTTQGHSDCERFPIFFEGKPDLDVTGNEIEDISFCDLRESSSSKVDLEPQIKPPGSWIHHGHKELNKVLPITGIRRDIYKVGYHTWNVLYEHFFYFLMLCLFRQNLYIPQTRYSKMQDNIILSPQYLSGSNINGRKSVSNRRKRRSKDINNMILNCTLDNAIQMANNLKTTTELMIQAVSEDLAKVKIQALSSGTAHQY